MDTTTAAQWPPQEMLVRPMEEMPKGSGGGERKLRAQKEQVMNCPRCNSTNTKFCYYNNYSLSQPRYFCKTCRRYWTEGGSLRNIPVGGGSRKNKRSSSSSPSPSLSSSKKLPDLVQNPKILDSQDLNLGFALHHHNHNNHNHHDFKEITDMIHHIPSSSAAAAVASSHHMSSLELLTGLAATSRGLSTFMPPPLPTSGDHYSTTAAFALPEFKPSSLNFSLDGYGSFQGVQETNGKLLFPFEDLKMSNNGHDQQNRDQNTNGDNHNSSGYWNGVIGGGGSW